MQVSSRVDQPCCEKMRPGGIDAPHFYWTKESVLVGGVRCSDASSLHSGKLLLQFLLDILGVRYAGLFETFWALTSAFLFSNFCVLLVQRDQVRVWENKGERPGEWDSRIPLKEGIFHCDAVVWTASFQYFIGQHGETSSLLSPGRVNVRVL